MVLEQHPACFRMGVQRSHARFQRSAAQHATPYATSLPHLPHLPCPLSPHLSFVNTKPWAATTLPFWNASPIMQVAEGQAWLPGTIGSGRGGTSKAPVLLIVLPMLPFVLPVLVATEPRPCSMSLMTCRGGEGMYEGRGGYGGKGDQALACVGSVDSGDG